jgi:hypothetical protein
MCCSVTYFLTLGRHKVCKSNGSACRNVLHVEQTFYSTTKEVTYDQGENKYQNNADAFNN